MRHCESRFAYVQRLGTEKHFARGRFVMKNARVLCMLVLVCLIPLFVFASTGGAVQTEPATLNYQGTLTDNAGQPLTGSKTITIRLYTMLTGGSAFWTDTYTVNLFNGQFSVTLGSDANPLSAQLSQFNGVTYVGVQVGSDPEMTPRQKMTSVPYAFNGIPKGGIIMWSGSISNIPAGWALCDGTNGTPDLRNRFIVGAGSSYAVGATGGEATHVLTINEMPSHSHPPGTGSSRHFVVDGSSSDPTYYGPANINVSGLGYITSTATGSTGGGAAHENRPPYYALAYIMKL
jgi:microcystin-dependent protein